MEKWMRLVDHEHPTITNVIYLLFIQPLPSGLWGWSGSPWFKFSISPLTGLFVFSVVPSSRQLLITCSWRILIKKSMFYIFPVHCIFRALEDEESEMYWEHIWSGYLSSMLNMAVSVTGRLGHVMNKPVEPVIHVSIKVSEWIIKLTNTKSLLTGPNVRPTSW